MNEHPNLFEIPEEVETNISLLIKKPKVLLSKEQQMFNNLTKRISTLEEEIKEEGEKLQRVLSFYTKEFNPVKLEVAKTRIELAMTLGQSSKKVKIRKSQKSYIRSIILELCDIAFETITPNEEEKVFFNEWSNLDYDEEILNAQEAVKEELADMINEEFGLDMDPDEIEDSEEFFEKFLRNAREQMEKMQNRKSKPKKKTKKQSELEAQKELTENLKKKSVRNIYIALAKLLHPDKELDEDKKNQKEELMKQVTTAYEKRDLLTLLKLELQWISGENEHLESISNDQLKLYISVLKEQVKNLEKEKSAITCHPIFYEINDFRGASEAYAIKKILEDKSKLKKMIAVMNDYISGLNGTKIMSTIKLMIKDFEQSQDSRISLDDILRSY